MTDTVQKSFRKMKADIKIKNGTPFRGAAYSLDVKNGVFELTVGVPETKVSVADIDIKGRHILLNIQTEVTRGRNATKSLVNNKWLCGHDERDWFVGAIPGTPKNITEAKQSLKPKEAKNHSP